MTPLLSVEEREAIEVTRSPITDYLARQQTLETPVAHFAREQDRLKQSGASTTSRLIPLSVPQPGQQLAFEVNLDACTGCKACVAACHSMNGLHEAETWRDVGVIFGATNDGRAYQQTITSACHHCASPECLHGCPVLAYEKDPLTGIVRHLDDQCIGCQYCVLKCPYDVPKYNKSLGIVRKCDMCAQRLAEGEAPACVAACPTEAIRITIVDTPTRNQGTENFLASAPSPEISLPTTRFISEREIPANAISGDIHRPRIEDSHYPLVVMLTLTQFGLGGVFAGFVGAGREVLTLGAVLFFAGLAASPLHLGRPFGAWRAFLGLRRSWLSREIVLFGAAAPMLALAVVQHWGFLRWNETTVSTLSMVATAAAVFASAMIYIDTHRQNWRSAITFAEFGGTLTLGFATVGAISSASKGFSLGGAAITFGLILFQLVRLRQGSEKHSPAAQRATLLRGPLRSWTQLRFATLSLTGLLCILSPVMPVLAFPAALLALTTELVGRKLYFQAVVAPRMPGGLGR